MNPYKTLGVKKNATQKQIQAAYRKLAAKYPPDRGGDPAKMSEVNVAYAILGDPPKRLRYDKDGSTEPVVDLKEEARQSLFQLLESSLASIPEAVDVAAWMKASVRETRLSLAKELASTDKKIVKLLKIRERLQDDGFFEEVFEEKLAALKQHKESVKHMTEITQKAAELLKDVSWRAPRTSEEAYSTTSFMVDSSFFTVC